MKSRWNRSNLALITVLVTALIVAAAPGAAIDSESFDLEELADLRAAFDQGAGKVRIVTLLSPSCAYCVKGWRYLRKLLEEVPDSRLEMLVVWVPMLSGDSRALSREMAERTDDPRVVYQAWDEERLTGFAYAKTMQSADERWRAGDGPAWDVYFVYPGEAVWDGELPPAPAYWQHQGAGPNENVLNYGRLEEETEKQLAALANDDREAQGQ